MYLPTSTVGNWSVSTRSGYVRYAVILTVREVETITGKTIKSGTIDGKRYATNDAAIADALAHGYLKVDVHKSNEIK